MSKKRDEDYSGEKQLKNAKEYLNRLLTYRLRSEAEVEDRLSKKGYPPNVIAEVIKYAKESKLIDDSRFAEHFVEDRLNRKPKGQFALRRELKQKGINEAIIEETLQEKFANLDIRKLIKDLAQKRLKRYEGEDLSSQYRKTTSFLKRRGFPPSDIYEIVRELIFD